MSEGRYRAVSLDLWYTAVFYASEADNRFDEVRLSTLTDLLRSGTGGKLDPSDIKAAVETVGAQLELRGLNTGLVDPQTVLQLYAKALGAELAVPSEKAGQVFSAAGLAEYPPRVNPELPQLMEALTAKHLPVIAITNTARRGESWMDFFHTHASLEFDHIITSCEVGHAKPDLEIFLEAARRLGIAPDEILHVGDRWELDINGAHRAGSGAVLYRGLWSYYPEGMYPPTDPTLFQDSSVLTIDRLEDLLTSGWL